LEEIRERALALIEKTEAGTRPVRLLGVSLHNLEDGAAPALSDGQPALELAGGGSAAGAGAPGEPREEGEQEKEH
jgi:hypothetical protein